MGRKASLTPGEVDRIRGSTKTLKELAKDFGVTALTVWKAKNFKSPYTYKTEVDDRQTLIDFQNENADTSPSNLEVV